MGEALTLHYNPAFPLESPTMTSPTAQKHYPEVDPRPSYPAIERGVLARWKAEDTFQRSVDENPAGENGANEYVFYDGPPFANGLPHYGHLVTGYVKDIIPRYQTMRGRRVERRFGWDCHGLPAEMEAEKELGVSGRAAIARVRHRSSFQRQLPHPRCCKYTEEWERYVTRRRAGSTSRTTTRRWTSPTWRA